MVLQAKGCRDPRFCGSLSKRFPCSDISTVWARLQMPSSDVALMNHRSLTGLTYMNGCRPLRGLWHCAASCRYRLQLVGISSDTFNIRQPTWLHGVQHACFWLGRRAWFIRFSNSIPPTASGISRNKLPETSAGAHAKAWFGNRRFQAAP